MTLIISINSTFPCTDIVTSTGIAIVHYVLHETVWSLQIREKSNGILLLANMEIYWFLITQLEVQWAYIAV